MTRLNLVQKVYKNNWLIYIAAALTVAYITYLAFSIHEGIFYAGDQALKALEVKQIAAGYGFKYLHLAQPAWVQDVWKSGYFPLRPPFFYPSPGGYIIVYPPMFQIISSFFYSAFGSKGLYILPMLCTFVLLTWVVVLLKRTGATALNIAASIFILVFCSPLILYGVMFWEHLPAVLLLFAGVAFLANKPTGIAPSAILGLIAGQAIWLRPEALMMNFLYCVAAGILFLRSRDRVYIAFVAAIALSLIPWLIFNKVEYGSIFGIHGMQVLRDNNAESKMGLSNGLRNLLAINRLSLRCFLFILFLFPVLYRVGRWQQTADLRIPLLAGIVIIYSLATPFMLPNDGVVQWGPRYFLAIIPVTVVALSLAETKWNLFANWTVPWWLTLLLLYAGYSSFAHNTHGGGYKELRRRYNHRLTNIYNLIDSKPGNVVIVSNYGMTHDFGYLFDKAYFFAAGGNDSLRRLIPLLKSHGVRQFIYVFDPYVPTLPTMLEDSTTRHYFIDAANKVVPKEDLVGKVYTIQ
jgi:hypothetical protein